MQLDNFDGTNMTSATYEAAWVRVYSDLDEARRLFQAGLALWRDRPFGAFHDEPSLATYVLQLEERRLAALERRFEVELDLGAHAGLVAELTALAVEHPYREHLRGQLMLALYRSGRQVDALRVYRDLRMTLVTGLGIEPSQALDALQAAMLRNDSARHEGGDADTPDVGTNYAHDQPVRPATLR
jgi:DNA-binding SARP family transcriptional activator